MQVWLRVDDCHFRLAKCIEAMTAERPSDSGALPAAEGKRIVVNQRIVDPHHSSFDLLDGLHGFGEIGGKDVGSEAELRAIRQVNGFLEMFYFADGRNRSKQLFVEDRHVRRHVGQNRRLVEPASRKPRRDAATRVKLGASRHCVLRTESVYRII